MIAEPTLKFKTTMQAKFSSKPKLKFRPIRPREVAMNPHPF